MAGFNDIWRVWWKGQTGDYVELSTFTYRNITGGAVVSAEMPVGAYGVSYPGVVRFTVEDVTAGVATITSKIIQSGDANHPDLKETGVPVTLGEATTGLFGGCSILLSTSTQEGDVFDIAEGYSWDSTNEAWIPQRAFGILLQGEISKTYTMKAKNISANPRVFVSVAWDNNGTAVFWAREVSGIWKAPTETPILVTGPGGVLGYIGPDEEFEIEFRASVPDAVDAGNNPIELDVVISGEMI